MTIEEILKAAGVEDADTIAKVKDAMPKSFIPLEDHNKRVAKAKQEAEEARAALDEAKKAAEDAAKAAAAKADEDGAKAGAELEELKKQLEKLQGDYSASQAELKSGKASKALEYALKAAGANPAAVQLLTASGVGSVEFSDDGKPSNATEVAESLKQANAGLFGANVDTGKEPPAGDPPANSDAFLQGFGATK